MDKNTLLKRLESRTPLFETMPRDASNPLRMLEGSAKMLSGGIGAAFSPLAPIIEPTIGAGVNYVANKISDIPAVQKFATSKAGEITSRVAEDVGNLNAIAGAVEGVKSGIPAISSVYKVGTKNLSNAFDYIKTNAIKYPKQVVDKITSGKINPQTKTILQETSIEKFDRYVKSGMEAIKDPRALTPLEQAGETTHRLASIVKEDLGRIGKQKSASLASVKDTRIPDIATEQIVKSQSLLQQKLTVAERALVNDYLNELKSLGKNPTAGSVDASIDRLQATLFEKSKGIAIPTTTRIKSFINQSIREINQKLKSAVDTKLGGNEYSVLNNAYTIKIKIFNILNKALGEGGTRGGSLFKRFFSPQDGGIKKLFQDIKEQYGVDLAQDATLAKFIMETLGDTRARSLLQLPPTTPIGILNRGLDYIEQKLTSPKRVLEKARTMIPPPFNL